MEKILDFPDPLDEILYPSDICGKDCLCDHSAAKLERRRKARSDFMQAEIQRMHEESNKKRLSRDFAPLRVDSDLNPPSISLRPVPYLSLMNRLMAAEQSYVYKPRSREAIPVIPPLTLGSYDYSSHSNKMTRVRVVRNAQQFEMSSTTPGTVESLLRAVSIGKFALVRDILASGVDPNGADSRKRTGLHIAVTISRQDIVMILLDYGADPNLTDIVGNTPLHLAVCGSTLEIVEMLLERGADERVKDGTGKTVAMLCECRYSEFEKCMRNEGVTDRIKVIKEFINTKSFLVRRAIFNQIKRREKTELHRLRDLLSFSPNPTQSTPNPTQSTPNPTQSTPSPTQSGLDEICMKLENMTTEECKAGLADIMADLDGLKIDQAVNQGS